MSDSTTALRETEATSLRRSIPRKRRRLTRPILGSIILLALLVGGYFEWRHLSTFESTDDAQVDGHINAISARISGQVLAVRAENEVLVHAGDVLVRIDPRDYEVAVEKAAADLADAQAAYESSRISVPITSTTTSSQLTASRSARADAAAGALGATRQLNAAEARLESARAQVLEAEANYQRASDDVARYKALVDKDEVPRQVYDTAVSAAAAARATVDARKAAVTEAEQNVNVANSGVEQANQRIAQAEANVQSALTAPQQVAVTEARVKSALAEIAQRRALLDQAKLNLSYTTVVAPVTGIVGKKTVEVGHNISPGQQLMAIVPLDDIWVTANFKETQLRHMKTGQTVRFSVDAYGREYTGKVTGVAGASGSRFSLLPPENATGNYVKVVQRIPVRIDIDPDQNRDHLLRPGMSVDPRVYLE
jgi:membrane fusion protein (multidrug efflux system)